MKVYFFDIGQGDSALIVSPTGKTVLIDAGPPEGGSHLKERLDTLLTGPIDLVILTHPHLDHYGGMIKAISAHGAKLFMDSGFEHPAKTYDALLSYLQDNKIPVKDADIGRKIDLGGGAVLTILSGGKPYITGTRSDPNANSVVTRLTYGKRAFYFRATARTRRRRACCRAAATSPRTSTRWRTTAAVTRRRWSS